VLPRQSGLQIVLAASAVVAELRQGCRKRKMLALWPAARGGFAQSLPE